MANQLYASVTGCSSIYNISVSDNHTAPTSQATIQCDGTSLGIGDHVTIDLGYSGNHNRVFSGYVKNITQQQAPTKYEITCANAMIRAVDYFLVSTNPDTPFTRENITAEDLIGDLMAECGLTNYDGGSTGFTFQTNGEPLEVNLTSIYDYCKFIANIVAWHIYADDDGVIHFADRPPFPQGSDGTVATLSQSNCLTASYFTSDRDLRNRVVVYGAPGIYAEASAESPYLPAGFFKSVVIATPILTTLGLAQDTANYNLNLLNRLTIGGSATAIGNPAISCRSCVTMNHSAVGATGKFYVYGCEHSWGQEGYTTTVDLRK